MIYEDICVTKRLSFNLRWSGFWPDIDSEIHQGPCSKENGVSFSGNKAAGGRGAGGGGMKMPTHLPPKLKSRVNPSF
jgi:hypothetical protein